jgi:hypothetical protein
MPKVTQADKTDRTRTRRQKWQARFLAALAKVPSVSHAAKAAGVHRSTCYEWRDTDPQFAKAWEQSLETAVDSLVVAAFQRALRSSDTLLTFLLRCHRPATYNISHGEQIGEKAEEPTGGLKIMFDTGGESIRDLLTFPILGQNPKEQAELEAAQEENIAYWESQQYAQIDSPNVNKANVPKRKGNGE